MLTTDDIYQMIDDFAAIRVDREESIIIRRGNDTLPVQPVRIERLGGSGREQDSAGAQEVRGRVIVLGSTTFNVQPGDRFNDSNDVLYQVTLVRPNRTAAVMAEAEAVE